MSLISRALARIDSWTNTLTGQGTGRDKTEYTEFSSEGTLSDDTLESLFNENPMAARLCEAPGDHMLRRGFTIKIPDNPELAKKIDERIKELGLTSSVKDGIAWDRCFGGALIVLGLNDGKEPNEPLDEKSVNGFTFLNTIDRRFIWPVYWYTNPNKPKFGLPETYRITYVVAGSSKPGSDTPQDKRTFEIHESRLALFFGARATMRSRLRRGGWGNSVLSRSYRALRSFDSVWASVEALVADASQGVYKLKNLLEMIAANGETDVLQRLRLMDMGRSTGRAIVIDADTEDFERRETSMSGLPELVDRAGVRLASVADVPVTVLLGIAPAGLNATGAGDIRNWYDSLEAIRTQDVDPVIRQIVRLIMLDKQGPCGGQEPATWSIEYAPLWQETKLEKAQVALTQSQSDGILIDKGVITAEECGSRRAAELEINGKSREKAIAEYEKQLESGVGELEPPAGVGAQADTLPIPGESKPTPLAVGA